MVQQETRQSAYPHGVYVLVGGGRQRTYKNVLGGDKCYIKKKKNKQQASVQEGWGIRAHSGCYFTHGGQRKPVLQGDTWANEWSEGMNHVDIWGEYSAQVTASAKN